MEHIATIKNAIGVEPPKQILMNALRKLTGRKPRHWNEDLAFQKQKVNEFSVDRYALYLQNRFVAFEKNGIDIAAKKISLALVWVLPSGNDAGVKKMWETIQLQSTAFDKIYIVGKVISGAGIKIEAQYFESLNEACLLSKEDYLFIVKDVVELHTFFVQECKNFIVKKPTAEIFYTCDDTMGKDGVPRNAQFKPQFNHYLLYSSNYIGCNILVKRSMGAGLNWFETTFADAYVYDFILRASEHKTEIHRIDEVLVHRVYTNKEEDIKERLRILQNHLIRIKDYAKVALGMEQGTTRLLRSTSNNPVVSIIIPFRDQVSMLESCVESILSKTKYKNYEVILANNGSNQAETKVYLDSVVMENQMVSVFNIDIPFNFSKINNYAVESCRGDYVLFLNNDTEVINANWLDNMVAELEKEDVGVVGAKLLYADNTVQHAGVIFGVGHVAGHAFRFADDNQAGIMRRANAVQEYLAVTGACLLTKKEIFVAAGKFDEKHLSVSNNDVDYCLKVVDLGYKIVYTPYAKLYHYESKSRAHDLSESERERYAKEVAFMKEKWGAKYAMDPFFHPHLDKRYENFENLELAIS